MPQLPKAVQLPLELLQMFSACSITYTLKNEAQIKERINVCICVSHILGEVFFVEDVYISDGFDPEGALIE